MRSNITIFFLVFYCVTTICTFDNGQKIAALKCKILDDCSVFADNIPVKKQNLVRYFDAGQEADIRAAYAIALRRREIEANKAILQGATFGALLPFFLKYLVLKDRADFLDIDTLQDVASAIALTTMLRKSMVDHKNKDVQLQEQEFCLRERLNAQNIFLHDLPKKSYFLTSSFCVGVGLSSAAHMSFKAAASSCKVNIYDFLSAVVVTTPAFLVLFASLLTGNDDDLNKNQPVFLTFNDKKLQLSADKSQCMPI